MLKYLLGTAFRAEALSRPALFGFCSSFLLPAHSFWLVLAVDKRVRPGKAREAKLLWLAAPSGPIALLHIGLKCDVRHSAAAEQAAGALLWFVLAAAKRVRPPSALDAKLSTFYIALLWLVLAVGKRVRPGKALKTSKQASKRASKQASKPEPAKSR